MDEKKTIKYRVETEFLTEVKPPQSDVFRVVNDQYAWYTDRQNNSGGYFSTNDDVGHFVAFEAKSAKDAAARFEPIAEVENEGYCECCGERWYSYFPEYKPDERVKSAQLRYYDLLISPEIEVSKESGYGWTLEPRGMCYINLVAHYANGAKVRFTFKPVERPMTETANHE